MRTWILFISALLAAPAAARTLGPCPPIAHAESVLRPFARVVLGEVHGNAETPRFAAALACHAAKLGPLRVGLEIPVDEQPRIDAFLASGDRAALLKGPFWTESYQDGRRSVAMAALLGSLHELRRQGADVKVVLFDVPGAGRETAMADRLAAAFAAEPKATFVVLTGNLHARKTPGTFNKEFMTAQLVAKGAKVTSLDAHYGDGTSWICTGAKADSCLPTTIGSGAAAAPAIVLGRSADGAYDGTFEVGSPRFSPPAAIALTAAQKTRAQAVALMLQARSDYEHKRYAKCGARYVELARRDASVRADADYNAACCFALAGDRGHAFAALGSAVDGGLKDADVPSKDEDLASLRSDARWAPLLDRIRNAAR